MGWFGRGRGVNRSTAPARDGSGSTSVSEALRPLVDGDDSPTVLRASLAELNRFINRSAGRLPMAAVVDARRITDTLAEVVDTSSDRTLDVYAVLTVKGTVTDYLPTTLRSYLAVDDDLLDTPRGTGLTPRQSLLGQLFDLQTSATATLAAVRNQDADALMTQGNFLRTKFARSDLDL